jgi:uncharacterized protein (DUF305 family)
VSSEAGAFEDGASEDTAPSPGRGGRPGTAVRVLVAAAAVVAILLLGAAAGLLIGLPGVGERGSTPDAASVDVGFAQDMAAHHLQAVEMANVARQKTADPAVRQLAFDIESTQLEQVGRMKGWLSLWGQPEQSPDGQHMAWMAMSGEHQHGASPGSTQAATMPGMATQEELAKLRSLSGTDFDVYFLQLMLRHHQGGAPMAQFAAQHATQSAVRTLADNMLRAQTSEAELMKSMLAERHAQPLP